MATQLDDPRIVEFDVRTDEMLVNMGPQHPSTHGVLRLVLRTDGEIVSEVEPHIGYLHRCAEKIGENLTPRQWIPYTDRMDYLAGMNMNLGWSLCVEKLLAYQLPEKARHLRKLRAQIHLPELRRGRTPIPVVTRQLQEMTAKSYGNFFLTRLCNP
jgi:NADH-quinone oxidoreductase subunit D